MPKKRIGKYLLLVAFLMPLALKPASPQSDPLQATDHRVEELYKAKKYDEAAPLAQDLLRMARSSFGQADPRVAPFLFKLGKIVYGQGHRAEAGTLYEEALAISGPNNSLARKDIAELISNLGWQYAGPAGHSVSDLFQGTGTPEALALARRFADEIGKRYRDDSYAYAVALSWLAGLYTSNRQTAEVINLYEESVLVSEKAFGSDSVEFARSLDEVAEHFSQTYDYKHEKYLYSYAEALLERALSIRGKLLPANNLETFNNCNNLAIFYYRQGKFQEAEPLYHRALAIEEDIFGTDSPELVTVLGNLAALFRAQGDAAKGAPFLQRAILISERAFGADSPEVADILETTALFYDSQRLQAQADALHQRALTIYERSLAPGSPELATKLGNVAWNLAFHISLTSIELPRRRYAEAAGILERVLVIRERIPGEDNFELSFTLKILAEAYQRLGRLADAEALLKRAQTIQKTNTDRDFATRNLAQLYFAQGRLSEAEALFKRILESEEASWGSEALFVSVAALELANVYHAQKHDEEAKALYERALSIATRDPQYEYVYALPAYNLLAAFWDDRGVPSVAISYARSAEEIVIKNLRREALSSDPRKAARGLKQLEERTGPFKRVIQESWLFASGRDNRAASNEAFIAAQWLGQTSAGLALSQANARVANGDSALAQLIRRQQILSSQRQPLEDKLISAHSTSPDKRNAEQERAAEKDLAELNTRIMAVDTEIKREFPSYYALAAPEPISIDAVQSLLRGSEALLFFTFTETNGFLWVIKKNEARWVSVGVSEPTLADKVTRLRCGLDRWGEWVWSAQANRWLARKPVCREARPNGLSRSELPPFDFKTAYELYHLLIAPVSEDIKGKNVLVVSTGILNSLPLGVLLTKEPNAQFATTNEDYRRANWFSTSYAFSMLPSVSSLQSRRNSSEFAAGSDAYLGFGDPLLSGRDGSDRSAWAAQTCATTARQFLSDGSRIIQQGLEKFFRGGLANVQQVRHQEPIPETADELCSIARELNTSSGDIYLGERATEKNLKELSRTGALRRFRIIHFATHALLAGETEEIAHSLAEPALILSPPEVATEEDDGLLTASEVAQLDINADWVILSACNTAAAGIKTSAEALSGLARAFFYAGARALLVSHWYVESYAAASLTKETLAELKIKSDIGRSEALRYAMLKLVARGGDWAHPALWGPFVVVGANSR